MDLGLTDKIVVITGGGVIVEEGTPLRFSANRKLFTISFCRYTLT